MNARSILLGLPLLLLLVVGFSIPYTIVRGQYANGPLISVAFRVLNQTRTMHLQGLNPILLSEVLGLAINTKTKHHGVSWATLTLTGGGTYHIGQPAQTQAAIWTGKDNRTINTIDYTIFTVSADGWTTSQNIHVFNVPGAIVFLLTDTYDFSSMGNYELVVRLTLTDAYVENSTNIHVIYP
jgi:hypothetical protein